MDQELERLNILCDVMHATIDKHTRLLFNAWSLTHPEILQTPPPYDAEYFSSLISAYYKYLEDLDAMGKHELYVG